jgi:hypothetical protein
MFFLQVGISNVLRFISNCDLFTDSPSYIKEIFTLAIMCVIRGRVLSTSVSKYVSINCRA